MTDGWWQYDNEEKFNTTLLCPINIWGIGVTTALPKLILLIVKDSSGFHAPNFGVFCVLVQFFMLKGYELGNASISSL